MPLALDPKTGLVHYQDREGNWKPTKTRTDATGTLAWDGETWQRIAGPRRTGAELTEDVGRSISHGVTLGFRDRIEAALQAAQGGGPYEQNLAREQARTEQIPPEVRMTGEAIGGLVPGALIPGGLPARAAAAVPAWLRNAAIGGLMGGAYGAGGAKPGEMGTGALVGAGTGAVLGTAIPAGMEAGRRITQGLAPEAAAGFDLARAFQRDAIPIEQAAARLRDMQQFRPGALISDVGGPNVQGLYERIAQTPGAGRAEMIPALERRQFGQLSRI